MIDKVMVTCAVTGGGDTADKSKAVPVTSEQIANSALDAWRAGAAIVHIHVRNPETGKPSRDPRYYREVVERIRGSNTDVIINLTTGPGARYVPDAHDPSRGGPGTAIATPAERVAHILELRPEICSLDIATMNFGESVFMNTPPHLREMAKAIRESGTRPELECFDAGHVMLARRLIDEGALDAPALFQLCLGIGWGAPADTTAMSYMSSLVPKGSHWAAFGISRTQFPMVAQAVVLGGHVRVGLEDNLYLERGKYADSNAELVEKAVKIIRLLGSEVMSPAEVRQFLGLRGRT